MLRYLTCLVVCLYLLCGAAPALACPQAGSAFFISAADPCSAGVVLDVNGLPVPAFTGYSASYYFAPQPRFFDASFGFHSSIQFDSRREFIDRHGNVRPVEHFHPFGIPHIW